MVVTSKSSSSRLVSCLARSLSKSPPPWLGGLSDTDPLEPERRNDGESLICGAVPITTYVPDSIWTALESPIEEIFVPVDGNVKVFLIRARMTGGQYVLIHSRKTVLNDGHFSVKRSTSTLRPGGWGIPETCGLCVAVTWDLISCLIVSSKPGVEYMWRSDQETWLVVLVQRLRCVSQASGRMDVSGLRPEKGEIS